MNIPYEKKYYLYFAPLSSLLFSIFHIINFWLIRKKEFKLSSLNKIYRRTTEATVQVATGLTGKSLGLIIGDLFGNTVNIFSGIHKLLKLKFSFNGVTLNRLFFVAKRYSDMPKYNLLPALLNSISLFLPAIYINKFYSSTIAGEFHLTTMILNVPIVFIGTSLSEVLIQHLSEKRQKKSLMWPEMKKMMGFLFLMGLFLGIVIWSIGPWLFSFFFGADWEISGCYAQIFVFLAIVRLVASPFNVAFVILERVKLFAVWQILYFIGILAISQFDFLSFNNFLWLLVVIGSFFYVINIILIRNIIINYDVSIKTGF